MAFILLAINTYCDSTENIWLDARWNTRIMDFNRSHAFPVKVNKWSRLSIGNLDSDAHMQGPEVSLANFKPHAP